MRKDAAAVAAAADFRATGVGKRKTRASGLRLLPSQLPHTMKQTLFNNQIIKKDDRRI